MPLVCLEGLSLFRRWAAMHYWLQNTPAMLFHLSGVADRESSFILEYLRSVLYRCMGFLSFSFKSVACTCLCNTATTTRPTPPSEPRGRLNGRYAKTTALSSPRPSALNTDRQSHQVEDKGGQRRTSVVRREPEIPSNAYHTNCVTSNSISTWFRASWHVSAPLLMPRVCFIFAYSFTLCLMLSSFMLTACILPSDFPDTLCSAAVILHYMLADSSTLSCEF